MERYCTNCRAELSPKADACPACGVFAGDVFDGTWPRKKSHTRGWLLGLVVTIAIAAAALWFERTSREQREDSPITSPHVRVVRDAPGTPHRSPGAAVNEAEAIRLLRRHLVDTKRIQNDCIALIADRDRAAYSFVVFDSCSRVRLGRWHVDPKSGRPGPG